MGELGSVFFLLPGDRWDGAVGRLPSSGLSEDGEKDGELRMSG